MNAKFIVVSDFFLKVKPWALSYKETFTAYFDSMLRIGRHSKVMYNDFTNWLKNRNGFFFSISHSFSANIYWIQPYS